MADQGDDGDGVMTPLDDPYGLSDVTDPGSQMERIFFNSCLICLSM